MRRLAALVLIAALGCASPSQPAVMRPIAPAAYAGDHVVSAEVLETWPALYVESVVIVLLRTRCGQVTRIAVAPEIAARLAEGE